MPAPAARAWSTWRGGRSARGRSRWGPARSGRGSTPSRRVGALDLRRARARSAARSAAAQSRIRSRPRRGRAASGRGSSVDRLEHQQLGAVQVADDRDVRARRAAAASWSGVRWCRCRTSAPAAPTRLQRVAPSAATWASSLRVVERGEDPVRRARAVLVGRVQRRVARPSDRARRAPASCPPGGRRGRDRSDRRRRGARCSPERIVTSHPLSGSVAARLRATWAEPPRG